MKIILRAWAWFPWWYKTLYWYRVTIIYENSVADFHAHYLLDLNYQELYSPCLIGHGLISPCNSSIISLWILFFFWFQQYCIEFSFDSQVSGLGGCYCNSLFRRGIFWNRTFLVSAYCWLAEGGPILYDISRQFSGNGYICLSVRQVYSWSVDQHYSCSLCWWNHIWAALDIGEKPFCHGIYNIGKEETSY